MATARDLKDVLKDALAKSGALGEIRAKIRAEVFNILQDESEPPNPVSNENILINELIREYLIFNGYLFTESVLVAESGHPNFPLQRQLLEERLKVKVVDNSSNMPLLYELVSQFVNQPKSEQENPQSEELRSSP
nr:centrosomal protein 20 [Parasteatoda tepidariorum]